MSQEPMLLTELWGHECPEGSAVVIQELVDPETGEKVMMVTCYDQLPVAVPHTVNGVIGLSIGTHEEQYKFAATYTPGSLDLTDVEIVEELTP